jgi:hypothetical protein
MNSFIHRHAGQIKGVLCGRDRLRFRGTLRAIAHPWGLQHFLLAAGVYPKDFKDFALAASRQVIQATTRLADQAGRPLVYLPASTTGKEDQARAIARRDGTTRGLVAILSTVELCWSFEVVLNPRRRSPELRAGKRKCLHCYHYYLDPDFGLVHARVQTWLPFTLHACANGRERLARQMDRAGLRCAQRDNCFTEVSDFARAQALLDEQQTFAWSAWPDGLAGRAQPEHADLFAAPSLRYSWSVNESAWATDVVFDSPAALLAAPVCRAVRWQGRRARALNPLAAADARRLRAVSRGEFAINGFRNRDLRPLLFGAAPAAAREARRQSATVTRQRRLRRAHRLIHKVAPAHRYVLSDTGRKVITALLAAGQADAATLLGAA